MGLRSDTIEKKISEPENTAIETGAQKEKISEKNNDL